MHDPNSQECQAIRRVLDVLGRSWAGPLLWAMLKGAERYGEIKAGAPGVSDAVLATRLREFTEHGLAERLVDPGPPVQVRYVLTDAGRDTRTLLGELQAYAARHPEVLR
ncbi:winged helix-turn-helix transcriptional regulator [Luteipulveratus mongoliensis]|uniref:HTH hxlR-type domain-containing protein n=1 Tax=Luteipulveratus mongoliensis TaxID=571913 RepID=A0A0K1JEL8_9MICO|nr:helix-turn-helix domain-containing protein [Luteipulveratus mongoliensis]AKU15035.1 hypothetical protein VV02_02790 [Luteipulveratus mongoliensis]